LFLAQHEENGVEEFDDFGEEVPPGVVPNLGERVRMLASYFKETFVK
jgi:hypothetical protein